MVTTVSTQQAGESSALSQIRPSRGELFQAACPSREVFKHVTSLWGVLALVALQDGTQRFSELRRRVAGVSEKMLAQTLQLLEADGLLVRRAHPVVPPHVDYTLTTLGLEVSKRVAALAECIEVNLPQVMRHRKQGVAPQRLTQAVSEAASLRKR